MKPGRELDALIAEKVMQIRLDLTHYGYPTPRYSTNIAAAWEVVEKIKNTLDPLGRMWKSSIEYCGSPHKWRCEFNLENDNSADDITYYWSEGDTASYAICLAALKAIGYEVQDGN